MKNKILNDSIKEVKTTVVSKTTKQPIEKNANIWFWFAIVELLFIFFLLLSRKKINATQEDNKTKFKQKAMNETIDFENIINSSFQAKKLYDKLKIKCHPDRFPTDDKKNKIALKLFQEIAKNKTNYKNLVSLKKEAEVKLGIKD